MNKGSKEQAPHPSLMQSLQDELSKGSGETARQIFSALRAEYLDAENNHFVPLLISYEGLLSLTLRNNSKGLSEPTYDELWRESNTMTALLHVLTAQDEKQVGQSIWLIRTTILRDLKDPAEIKSALEEVSSIFISVADLLPEGHLATPLVVQEFERLDTALDVLDEVTRVFREVTPSDMTRRPLQGRTLYGE